MKSRYIAGEQKSKNLTLSVRHVRYQATNSDCKQRHVDGRRVQHRTRTLSPTRSYAPLVPLRAALAIPPFLRAHFVCGKSELPPQSHGPFLLMVKKGRGVGEEEGGVVRKCFYGLQYGYMQRLVGASWNAAHPTYA